MNLKNHFVVAMPTLNDPLFSHSVVFICEHNRDGAMGIIVNKPIIDLTVQTVLSRLDITPYKNCAELEQLVFNGGPLAEEQGFILHTPQSGFSSSIVISDEIMITTSLDVLKTIGSENQPKDIFLTLGYASWSHMQLEHEIAKNDWLVTPSNTDIIFNLPIAERWNMAAQTIGVNIETMSTQMGKA